MHLFGYHDFSVNLSRKPRDQGVSTYADADKGEEDDEDDEDDEGDESDFDCHDTSERDGIYNPITTEPEDELGLHTDGANTDKVDGEINNKTENIETKSNSPAKRSKREKESFWGKRW